jgi:two-component system response regulator NreC
MWPVYAALPMGDYLSDRETEVLRLIALGHTNTEVGHQLSLSVRTIESHRAHIQRKLRASTRAELVRYAIEHNILYLANGAGK